MKRGATRTASRAVALAWFLAALSLGGCATMGQLNLVSEADELAMGAQFAAELEKELTFIHVGA